MNKYLIQLLGTGTFIALLASAPSQAATLRFDVEPLIGYERVQKILPTAHATNRLMYGGRVSLGIPLLSAEVEYTRGSDTETYPVEGLTLQDTDDKLKLGARSNIRLSMMLSAIARAGVQAKRNTHTETLAGVETKTVNPTIYKPYAGAGLTVGLSHKIALTGLVTVVFNQWPLMAYNEYQTALGFVIRLP